MSSEVTEGTSIRVLGPVRLERNAASIEPGARREQALLALLAAEARPLSRQRLAALLWPNADETAARGRLRRLLHELANRVGGDALAVERQSVALARDVCGATDLASLRHALARGLYQSGEDASPAALSALERAAALSRPQFAEGLALDECEELSMWLERQRESLWQGRKQVLARLVTLYERGGRYDRALLHAQEFVVLDPLDEAGQRQLIRVHGAGGDLRSALQQFDRCRQLLRDELAVEPEPATSELAALIRDRLPAPAPSTAAALPPGAIRFTRSGNVHLAYQVVGTGPLDLLLISGFVSNLDQAWAPGGPGGFLHALAQHFRLILYDRRGVGLSDRTVDPADTTVSSADALAVLAAAGSRRALVFAVSEGGPIAVRLAVEHPARVAGLALWGTIACGTAAPDHPWALTPEEHERRLAHLVSQWGRPEAIAAFAPDHANDALLQHWWARMLRLGSSPRCMAGVLKAFAMTDVRALLPRVRAPTLVMHRTGDRIVRVGAGRYVASAIPEARLLELPGTSHWWWLDGTRAILEGIRALGRRVHEQRP